MDPAWPKIPNNWQFGQVSSVSIDAQDNVWILQRPDTLQADEKPRAAPPLVEFDSKGNFIQGWGGPGPGYEWPSSEHGVYVDPKGYVWIGGNGAKDNQILKFTKAGKFILQIGRAGQSKGNADTQNLNRPADTFLYAKTNELFVADGYGNRRVIVFARIPANSSECGVRSETYLPTILRTPRFPMQTKKVLLNLFSPCTLLGYLTTGSCMSLTGVANECRCSRSAANIYRKFLSVANVRPQSAVTEARPLAPLFRQTQSSVSCTWAIEAKRRS